MGAIADAIVSYAQPLFDGTDGSESEMNRAMTVAQMCRIAPLPEDHADGNRRDEARVKDDGCGVRRNSGAARPPNDRASSRNVPRPARAFQPMSNTVGVVPSPSKKHPERIAMLLVLAGVDANTSSVAACGNDQIGETFNGRLRTAAENGRALILVPKGIPMSEEKFPPGWDADHRLSRSLRGLLNDRDFLRGQAVKVIHQPVNLRIGRVNLTLDNGFCASDFAAASCLCKVSMESTNSPSGHGRL